MSYPRKHEFTRDFYGVTEITYAVWITDEGDVWKVHCMDCGIRLGTVNTGNESGAMELTRKHNEVIH